jgi:hypothetical protein
MKLNKKKLLLLELKKFTSTNKVIDKYLLDNSNLPGKRANIELALSFADYIEENYNKKDSQYFKYCLNLISQNSEGKTEAGNEEFLPFCSIIALGRIGKIDIEKQNKIIELLKINAQDRRWRIREAVAMAIQTLMDANPVKTLEKLQEWLGEDNYLIYRAIAAGLAEPQLMKNKEIARAALMLHKKLIEKVEQENNFKNEDFDILIKGLCYTLSVIITGNEAEGFEYLEELTKKNNNAIRKIVRENLKKNRLKCLNHSKVLELEEKIKTISINRLL